MGEDGRAPVSGWHKDVSQARSFGVQDSQAACLPVQSASPTLPVLSPAHFSFCLPILLPPDAISSSAWEGRPHI